MLGKDDALESGPDNMIATIATAAMTGRTIGNTYAACTVHLGLTSAILQLISPAFNQMVQSQLAPVTQLAAMSLHQQSPTLMAQTQCAMPPVSHVTFLIQQPFAGPMQQHFTPPVNGYGNCPQGQFGGGHHTNGEQGCGRGSSCGSCQRRPSFATQMRAQAATARLFVPHTGGLVACLCPLIPTQARGYLPQ
jgi:hypothetical protein